MSWTSIVTVELCLQFLIVRDSPLQPEDRLPKSFAISYILLFVWIKICESDLDYQMQGEIWPQNKIKQAIKK